MFVDGKMRVIFALATITVVVGIGVYYLFFNNNMEIEKNSDVADVSIDLEDAAIPGVENQKLYAVMKTNLGVVTLELFPADAPKTVENFVNLAESGFYDGTKFHRTIKDFMIQGGDPLSKDDDWSNDGGGGPGYQFEDEINSHKIVKGTLAMANAGPNTNGSQFFIVTADATPWLDGKHTVFGQVVEGMEAVMKIEDVPTNSNDHPTEDVVVESIEIVEM